MYCNARSGSEETRMVLRPELLSLTGGLGSKEDESLGMFG